MAQDQVDTSINLNNLVFDNSNQERRSWILFGQRLSRSAVVFLFQSTTVLILIGCSVARIILSSSCEETTVWVAILSSSVGYVLPSPRP